MTIGAENLSNGPATAQDQFSGGVTAYRQSRREAALTAGIDDPPLPTRLPGQAKGIEPTAAQDRAAQSSLDLQGLAEPAFGGWGETTRSASIADHPLLRGLLQELPVRGSIPEPDWLDRWFEAARSILELLYVQQAGRK